MNILKLFFERRRDSLFYLGTNSRRREFLSAVDRVSRQRKSFAVLNSQNFSLASFRLVDDGVVHYWETFFGHNCVKVECPNPPVELQFKNKIFIKYNNISNLLDEMDVSS